ncbi:MAG TPA: ATP-binding protein [Bryobacteraceae bacterium]|nr:ATP-binding protein [Bryobacteraceae bacterium]
MAATISRPALRSVIDRVLIHAPYGRDGALIRQELVAAGFFAYVCKSIEELCEQIAEGAGAALVADEALIPAAVNLIAEQLKSQPPWSDFPLLVMTSGGAPNGYSRYRLRLLEPLTNVTLLERPLRPETLTSSLRAALRARHRQYQLCELLSELAKNNGELKRTNHELTRVNRELEEFAWVASHDLQEPLRMVNIYTQLICEKFGGDQATDSDLHLYTGYVGQGVKRMERLIRDLLTFSRTVHIESRGCGSADLSISLAQAISILRNRIEENAAVIHAEGLPVVRGDAPQLAQVFQNLISNSIKYRKTEESPRIDITSEHKNGEWITAIHDNGIGFDQQYADRIFGLFKRLHKDEYPGTGLGLAICQRIVERYGGRMWANGKDGEGATFYFALQPAL